MHFCNGLSHLYYSVLLSYSRIPCSYALRGLTASFYDKKTKSRGITHNYCIRYVLTEAIASLAYGYNVHNVLTDNVILDNLRQLWKQVRVNRCHTYTIQYWTELHALATFNNLTGILHASFFEKRVTALNHPLFYDQLLTSLDYFIITRHVFSVITQDVAIKSHFKPV